MEKGKASRKIRKVLKDLMPALCKCNAYVNISLHFDNDKNDEFIIVTMGYIDDDVFTSKNNFGLVHQATRKNWQTRLPSLINVLN